MNRLFCALTSLALLAACGNDTSRVDSFDLVKEAVTKSTDKVRGASTAPAAPQKDLGLTRAFLATLSAPVDLVTIEQYGAQGVIAKIATNGPVETWSSIDHKTLGLRNGVIVSSRGLGDDLLAATVPSVADLSRDGEGHQRLHTTLGPSDLPAVRRYDCSIAAVGPETLVLVERSYATRHFRETCVSPWGNFVNDYWLQNSGKIRQSRQWISKTVGYVAVKHLSDG